MRFRPRPAGRGSPSSAFPARARAKPPSRKRVQVVLSALNELCRLQSAFSSVLPLLAAELASALRSPDDIGGVATANGGGLGRGGSGAGGGRGDGNGGAGAGDGDGKGGA